MENFVLAAVVFAMLSGVNQMRTQNQRLPVYERAELMEAAQGHAEYMAKTGDFAHGDVQARVRGYGYPHGAYENIAMGGNPIKTWVASGPHFSNMLANGVHIGVGAAQAANGQTYYVLLIGVGDG